MNRFFTSLIFLLIFSDIVLAQKSKKLNVTLRTDGVISPRGRLFAIDTVIDARIDTSSLIGTWQEPSEQIAELHFKSGFQPTLANFVLSSLKNPDKKLPSYVLIVREFSLDGMPETARFELAVTFCRLNNTGNSAANKVRDPVYTADIIAESNDKTITELLKKGIATAFLKFNDYLANPTTVSAVYSDSAIEAAKTVEELNLVQPIYDSTRTEEDNLLRCSQFRSGVYQSFNELRQNRPSFTGKLIVQEKNESANLRKTSGSRDRHRFFGFSDGKDLFISSRLYQGTSLGHRYVKVKSIGRYLLWIDDYITSGERTAQAVGASFGLIGALATASAHSYKDCIALDMQTGLIFMITSEKLVQMMGGHDDLLAELAAMPNKKDEQQQFDLLDKLNQRTRTSVMR